MPPSSLSVLVTGGAGFIGGGVVHALAAAGHQPVVLDNLSRGRRETAQGRILHVGDLGDPDLLDHVLERHRVGAVVHCAALTSVPESVADPVLYYQENVAKTLTLAQAMLRRGCHRLLYSSSASVYADAFGEALTERAPLAPASPYARSKAVVEDFLADLVRSSPLRAVSLRYFNPVGADPHGRWGPSPRARGTVLAGLLTALHTGTPFGLMGNDWPTRDGTAVRDFVHAQDVAEAHVAVLRGFDRLPALGRHAVVNIGAGRGTTIRELVEVFRAVTGWQAEVKVLPRREADSAGGYAVIDRARDLLGWTPRQSLAAAVRDAEAWWRVVRPELAAPDGP